MLILERKPGESVVIEKGDDKIEVTLTKDDKGRFKLCFDAPTEYKITRKELIDNEQCRE